MHFLFLRRVKPVGQDVQLPGEISHVAQLSVQAVHNPLLKAKPLSQVVQISLVSHSRQSAVEQTVQTAVELK